MVRKVYVGVIARNNEDGTVIPLSIQWKDGQLYEIDEILDKRRAASTKAGGIGIRYTVRVRGHSTYLFYEEPKWFVEGKEQR